MSARVAVALGAIGKELGWLPNKRDRELVEVALRSVESVTFNEAGIERGARAMLDAMYDDRSLAVSEGDRLIVRAVVAALREET